MGVYRLLCKYVAVWVLMSICVHVDVYGFINEFVSVPVVAYLYLGVCAGDCLYLDEDK